MGLCFECFRDTPEYKNNEYVKKQRVIDLSYQEKFEKKKSERYFNELIVIEFKKSDFVHNSLQQFADKSDNIVLDSYHRLHLKGLDYNLTLFYNILEPNKFYRFDTSPNRETFTQILIFFNSQKITIETFLERVFWDLSEYIESTDFLESFCYDVKNQIECSYKNKRSDNEAPSFVGAQPRKSSKKLDAPLKTVFIPEKNHRFQFYATYFAQGEYFKPTYSINLLEDIGYIGIYNMEVYDLLNCKNWYFHNFYINYYFDLEYLNFLKSKLDGYGNEFIRIRFYGNRMVLILKREINDYIKCSGNILSVLNKFLKFGYAELYSLLALFDIETIDFEKSLRLESYVSYHLAKDIGCNIDKEQPELRDMLKLNQMNNNKKSLAHIGLKDYVHYLDFSHGYWEYETEYKNYAGIDRAELERDLLVLEPDIQPKEQITIDKYLISNKKAFMLIKGYLPIPAFSIEPNRVIISNSSELIEKESNIHGLLIWDKSFSNRKFIRTKFISTDS